MSLECGECERVVYAGHDDDCSKHESSLKAEVMYNQLSCVVGPIKPVGETWEDEARYNNLLVMIKLVDLIKEDLIELSHDRQNKLHSVSYAARKAYDYLYPENPTKSTYWDDLKN